MPKVPNRRHCETTSKKGKHLEGEKNYKKKEGNAPRDKRIFEIIRQRILL
jgi:hypothetical protein